MAVVVVLSAAYAAATEIGRFVNRQRYLKTLATADGEAAKKAAWWIADSNRQAFAPKIRAALTRPDISADYREALVYTCGKLADRNATAPLRELLKAESSGFVRQATWLALARIDAQAFSAAADQPDLRRDPWDELGIAIGGVQTGNWAALNEVVRWAVDGNVDQRHIACRTLDRVVRPLLEAAGRWPVDFRPRMGEAWGAARVADIAQRMSEVNLRHVVDDTRKHKERMDAVQKNVRRLASGRAYIAWLLVGDEERRERERRERERNRH